MSGGANDALPTVLSVRYRAAMSDMSTPAAWPAVPSTAPNEASARDRARAINKAVLEAERRLRAQHRWLAHQDAIGAAMLIGPALLTLAFAAAYGLGWLPWWLAIPLIAMAISILHEMEHDLIHDLYFQRRRWLQNAAFTLIWVFKVHLDPWTRKRYHLLHHRRSGQPDDIEERLIGLGLPLGFRRLLLTVFPVGSALVFPGILRDYHRIAKARRPTPEEGEAPPVPPKGKRRGFRELWSGLGNAITMLTPPVLIGLALAGYDWASFLCVVWILPNLLRHAAIVVMSSFSHYYDIDEADVTQQNQILDHWVFWPLQLFCFNFGATHVIHHFVVRQPFYLRQMIASEVLPELERQGIPRNDFGTFSRANRRPDGVGVARAANAPS